MYAYMFHIQRESDVHCKDFINTEQQIELSKFNNFNSEERILKIMCTSMHTHKPKHNVLMLGNHHISPTSKGRMVDNLLRSNAKLGTIEEFTECDLMCV